MHKVFCGFFVLMMILCSNAYAQMQILNGVKKEYYEGEKNKSETPFKNGLIDGTMRSYSEDGKVWSESGYKEGRPHGMTRQYYRGTTQVEWELNYVDGLGIGPWREYYPSGKLRSDVTLGPMGKEGPEVEYFENGDIKKKANYKSMELTGPYVEYFENKEIKTDAVFQAGHPVKYVEYYPDRMIKANVSVSDDNEIYTIQESYESGKIKRETKNSRHDLWATITEYYENGKIKSSERRDNNLTVEKKEYDEAGNLQPDRYALKMKEVEAIVAKIKPGMKRSEVEQWFKFKNGGLSSGPQLTEYYEDPQVLIEVPYDLVPVDPQNSPARFLGSSEDTVKNEPIKVHPGHFAAD